MEIMRRHTRHCSRNAGRGNLFAAPVILPRPPQLDRIAPSGQHPSPACSPLPSPELSGCLAGFMGKCLGEADFAAEDGLCSDEESKSELLRVDETSRILDKIRMVDCRSPSQDHSEDSFVRRRIDFNLLCCCHSNCSPRGLNQAIYHDDDNNVEEEDSATRAMGERSRSQHPLQNITNQRFVRDLGSKAGLPPVQENMEENCGKPAGMGTETGNHCSLWRIIVQKAGAHVRPLRPLKDSCSSSRLSSGVTSRLSLSRSNRGNSAVAKLLRTKIRITQQYFLPVHNASIGKWAQQRTGGTS